MKIGEDKPIPLISWDDLGIYFVYLVKCSTRRAFSSSIFYRYSLYALALRTFKGNLSILVRFTTSPKLVPMDHVCPRQPVNE